MKEKVKLFDPDVKAKAQGWIVIRKEEVLADGPQAPGFITLCKTNEDMYATHFFNAQDGGFHSGHYSKSVFKAVVNFNERVERSTRHHARVKARG